MIIEGFLSGLAFWTDLDGNFSGEDESQHLPDAHHRIQKTKLVRRHEKVDGLSDVTGLKRIQVWCV